ncbi:MULTISPECIES: RNA polymerase sigma factor [Anaeromyxobacter]|uniref:RNA polymerase sigma factor n=1 Tax=Anaeromyxobacter TaxID=161492 RepID=UPI001F599AFF|nr:MULTISPECIES: RNA polymerase sigma factor [unclassified Anaeromyxobacter]
MLGAPTDTSDEELIRRSAARDRAAFDALVARHGGALLRFATRSCGTEVEAADALQDGLLAAWRGAGTFRGDASARTWLFQIVLHCCRRRARRRAGEPEQHAPVEAAADLPGADAPEARVAALQAGAALEQALASLPAAAREVLLLRDVEGLSGAETAAALSIDLTAMKSRLHRARLELKARVEERLGRALSEVLP